MIPQTYSEKKHGTGFRVTITDVLGCEYFADNDSLYMARIEALRCALECTADADRRAVFLWFVDMFEADR